MRNVLLTAACIVSLASAAMAQLYGGSPQIYSNDGKYLGNLNSNRYDPNSVSNPYGQYGSRYSADSINNPYGTYGSRYSSQSVNNPYATQAPVIVAPSGIGGLYGR